LLCNLKQRPSKSSLVCSGERHYGCCRLNRAAGSGAMHAWRMARVEIYRRSAGLQADDRPTHVVRDRSLLIYGEHVVLVHGTSIPACTRRGASRSIHGCIASPSHTKKTERRHGRPRALTAQVPPSPISILRCFLSQCPMLSI